MKDLDSQNVVKLIEVLRTENNFYIVSELCTGGDLKEYMKSCVIYFIRYLGGLRRKNITTSHNPNFKRNPLITKKRNNTS